MLHPLKLKNVTREIENNWETIDLLGEKTIEAIGEYLKECALQGQRLAPLKAQLGHGNWMTWCDANFPGRYKLIQRCLRVAANWTYLTNLNEPVGLHRALALLAERNEKESAGEGKQWPGPIEANLKLSKFVGYVARFPIRDWPEPSREAAREQLQPVAAALWPDKFL